MDSEFILNNKYIAWYDDIGLNSFIFTVDKINYNYIDITILVNAFENQTTRRLNKTLWQARNAKPLNRLSELLYL